MKTGDDFESRAPGISDGKQKTNNVNANKAVKDQKDQDTFSKTGQF